MPIAEAPRIERKNAPAAARPLRVCHLGKFYPPATGGIETHVRTLAQAQAALGIDVRVVCVNHLDRHGRDVGETIVVPVKVLRSPKLPVPVQLELRLPEDLGGVLRADAVTVAPGQSSAEFRITCLKDTKIGEEHPITIRGTALQDGRYAVVSEANLTIECQKK